MTATERRDEAAALLRLASRLDEDRELVGRVGRPGMTDELHLASVALKARAAELWPPSVDYSIGKRGEIGSEGWNVASVVEDGTVRILLSCWRGGRSGQVYLDPSFGYGIIGALNEHLDHEATC